MTGYQHKPALKALVVEDHEVSRRYISEALRRCGWAVKHCRSAEEALPLYRAWNPSLVIVDLNLPGANGLDLANQLAQRTTRGGQATTMLLLSAHSSPTLESRARSAGFDGVLCKPLDFRHFQRLLSGLPGNSDQRVRESRLNTGSQAKSATHPDEDLLILFQAELQESLPDLENFLLRGSLREAASIIHQLTASAAICGNRPLEIRLREFDAACRKPADVSSLARAFTRFHRNARTILSYPATPRSG